MSAKVALFGTVVEFDSGLVVLTSDGNRHRVAGEPVSWRVFPRSRHYEDHLHVIYDDRLEVHSFNHDYACRPARKNFGHVELYLEQTAGIRFVDAVVLM